MTTVLNGPHLILDRLGTRRHQMQQAWRLALSVVYRDGGALYLHRCCRETKLCVIARLATDVNALQAEPDTALLQKMKEALKTFCL